MRIAALLSLLALAACGADGPPLRPDGRPGRDLGQGGVSLGGPAGALGGAVSPEIGT